MSTIYKGEAGSLVRATVENGALISVGDLLSDALLVSTSFSVDRSQDVQYTKTLSSIIYAYAFGEAIGRLSIGGLVFFGSCKGSGGSGAIAKINDYYSQNNIYRKKDPSSISVGSVSFPCYLEAMSILAQENQFNYGSFNLTFSTIPDND